MNKTIIELREEAIKEDKNPEFYLYQKLEEKDKQLDKYKNVIDKIKELINHYAVEDEDYSKIYNQEEKDILELLEEIND